MPDCIYTTRVEETQEVVPTNRFPSVLWDADLLFSDPGQFWRRIWGYGVAVAAMEKDDG